MLHVIPPHPLSQRGLDVSGLVAQPGGDHALEDVHLGPAPRHGGGHVHAALLLVQLVAGGVVDNHGLCSGANWWSVYYLFNF